MSATPMSRLPSVEIDVELRPSFELQSPWGGAGPLAGGGLHQVSNALAAATAALALWHDARRGGRWAGDRIRLAMADGDQARIAAGAR